MLNSPSGYFANYVDAATVLWSRLRFFLSVLVVLVAIAVVIVLAPPLMPFIVLLSFFLFSGPSRFSCHHLVLFVGGRD